MFLSKLEKNVIFYLQKSTESKEFFKQKDLHSWNFQRNFSSSSFLSVSTLASNPPSNKRKKRKEKQLIYLSIVLDLTDFNLSWNVKTVYEISTKHKRVFGSKHSMDPA